MLSNLYLQVVLLALVLTVILRKSHVEEDLAEQMEEEEITAYLKHLGQNIKKPYPGWTFYCIHRCTFCPTDSWGQGNSIMVSISVCQAGYPGSSLV